MFRVGTEHRQTIPTVYGFPIVEKFTWSLAKEHNKTLQIHPQFILLIPTYENFLPG